MLDDRQRRDAADALARAEALCAPIAPLTTTWPAVEIGDAYVIQQLQIAARVDAGARVIGHKVGLSSRAMQQMLGVDEPDYGHLLDTMVVADAGTIDVSTLCQPKIEAEVAFILGEALRGPSCGIADVLAATASIAPALEIIDSRVADWKIGLKDTVADNASSARVVLGAERTSIHGRDLRTIGCVIRRGGEVVETGAAGAVLGHPAIAVAWLANTLHRYGVTLEAGHVILPGACHRAVNVAAGDGFRADFDGLGGVSVRFANAGGAS